MLVIFVGVTRVASTREEGTSMKYSCTAVEGLKNFDFGL